MTKQIILTCSVENLFCSAHARRLRHGGLLDRSCRMNTSKSPRKVAMTAWIIGQQSLPAYAHRFAPKKFTQPQLFACLVLKAFFHTDYRGIVTYLRDMPELCQSIELGKVPHFTTLHKAAGRLLRFHVVRRLLDSAVRRVMNRRRHVPRAAVDSSGFEAGQVSPYFIKRRSRLPSLW